jgi:hypothetical protein
VSDEPQKGFRVTCEDLETGEVGVRILPLNDYMVICTGSRYVAHTQTFKSGTAQVTIKRADGPVGG